MKESIPSRVQPPQAAKKPLFWFGVSGTLCRADSRLELVIRRFLLGCSPRACGRQVYTFLDRSPGSQCENCFPAARRRSSQCVERGPNATNSSDSRAMEAE